MVREIPSPGFESAPNAIWLPGTIESAALPNAATIKQTAVRRANPNIQRTPKSRRQVSPASLTGKSHRQVSPASLTGKFRRQVSPASFAALLKYATGGVNFGGSGRLCQLHRVSKIM